MSGISNFIAGLTKQELNSSGLDFISSSYFFCSYLANLPSFYSWLFFISYEFFLGSFSNLGVLSHTLLWLLLSFLVLIGFICLLSSSLFVAIYYYYFYLFLPLDFYFFKITVDSWTYFSLISLDIIRCSWFSSTLSSDY